MQFDGHRLPPSQINRTALPLCSYNDHGEEGKAHEDALHLDEQHGAGQPVKDGVVEARDHSCDVGS